MHTCTYTPVPTPLYLYPCTYTHLPIPICLHPSAYTHLQLMTPIFSPRLSTISNSFLAPSLPPLQTAYGNLTACQLLGNMCALNLYRLAKNRDRNACDLYQTFTTLGRRSTEWLLVYLLLVTRVFVTGY